MDDLAVGLLEASPTGLGLLTPIRSAEGDEIVDFAFGLLNEAAQRLLGLSARPAQSHRQLFPLPEAADVFAFYCRVQESGQPEQGGFSYRHHGVEKCLHHEARRVGAGLVVSFADAADAPHLAAQDVRRSGPAPDPGPPDAAGPARLHDFFMQAPAAFCIHRGPEHIYELVNPAYQEIIGNRPLLGRPMREALPELVGQQVYDLLDRVYRTGEPAHATELPVRFDYAGQGTAGLQLRYYNLTYQARRDAADRVDGVLVLAVDVTAQVLARHEAEASGQAAAAANEELQAANEEVRANNEQLVGAQQALHALNLELESRVTDRTAALQRAQVAAEQLASQREVF
ncbi:MAG: hypothetical protein NVSMB30_12200 [Hymenobacter sp.]